MGIGELYETISRRFQSGNSIDVYSARITQEEFGLLAADRDAAIEREQALSSSLERIVDAWMYDDTGIHDKHSYGVMLPVARYEGVDKAIMDSRLKGFSLKKRDLIKQAEAITAVAMKRPPDSVQRAWLLEQAEKYSQQAANLK